MSFGRVFSTGNLSLIRVPQYWINGVKGGCKGLEYSKMLKIPLCLSTGMASDTLIYHNACRVFLITYFTVAQYSILDKKCPNTITVSAGKGPIS